MKNFIYQVTVNYKRIVFRNPMFYGFALFMPIAFYLVFTKMIDMGISGSAMKEFQINYLISMAVYSALMSSIISVANTLLEDREHQFTLFLDLSPLSKIKYYLGMLLVFLPLTSLIVIVLGIVGILVNGVEISLSLWLIFIFLLPLLSLPLVFIGFLISLAGTSNAVNGLAQLVSLPMAMLSGLWWPLEMFPDWMQKIGQSLLAYQISTIIQEILNKEKFHLANIFGLIIWSIILLLILFSALRYIRRHELQGL